MALIGVLARIDTIDRDRVSQDLVRVDGVSLFSVDEQERIGIILERRSLGEAHAALKDEVESIPGLLGAWPVFSYADEEGDLGELAADNTQTVEVEVDG